MWQPSLPGKLFEFDRRRGLSKGMRIYNCSTLTEIMEVGLFGENLHFLYLVNLFPKAAVATG